MPIGNHSRTQKGLVTNERILGCAQSAKHHCDFVSIRESVDSLCRDGADTDTPIFEMKRIRTPERQGHKPFQTHNKLYECFSTIQDAQSV